MAASVWGSFFNDSNEDIAQLSPRLMRPGSQDDGMGFPRDDRRPSMASATTVSSSGSKSSVVSRGGYHKRLQNVFGEEFPQDSRQNSDTSLTAPYVGDAQSLRAGRNRTNSMNNTLGSSYNSRPGSPVSSRPRTPLPSSEVTPWEYQDFKVSVNLFGRRPTTECDFFCFHHECRFFFLCTSFWWHLLANPDLVIQTT